MWEIRSCRRWSWPCMSGEIGDIEGSAQRFVVPPGRHAALLAGEAVLIIHSLIVLALEI